MPIRATANGVDYITPLMSDAEWSAMRGNVKANRLHLTMPCCGAAGFPRQRNGGIRHFYHRDKATCNWKPETPDHIAIKSEIAKACRTMGCAVTPEACGPGWRADVLTSGNQTSAYPQIAFEIQWTPQNLETTEQRQAKYRDASVQCFWLFRTMPSPLHRSTPSWCEQAIGSERTHIRSFDYFDSNHLVEARLPIFHIAREEQGYFVELGHRLRRLPLADFVRHVLSGQIVFRPVVRIQREDATPILDDYEFYRARCGAEVSRHDKFVRWNHWCFAQDSNFCPAELPPDPRRNRSHFSQFSAPDS